MSKNHHYSNHTIINKTYIKPKSYTQQKVTLSNTPLFFPEGFEHIFSTIYFILLPYIAGLIFLFFYLAEGQPAVFLSIYEDSLFILIWSIGYEILAVLALLYIIKNAVSFSIQNSSNRKAFRRP